MLLIFVINSYAQNESVRQLNRYVKCSNELTIELNMYFDDFLSFKINYAKYLKNDNTFQGFKEPKKSVYIYKLPSELINEIEENKKFVTKQEHDKINSILIEIENELAKIYLTHKYVIEYFSENNNKVKIDKEKPKALIIKAAESFDKIYVLKEELRTLITTTYKKKYAVKHKSSVINNFQMLSEQSTNIAHNIQFNLRNNDTSKHRELTHKLFSIHDSLQKNKELFFKEIYYNIPWVNTDFVKGYPQFCWTIKRFCNFSEDLYNTDKFLKAEVDFFNKLKEPWFPEKYNTFDAMHNQLLIGQICDNEIIYTQQHVFNYFDVTYLNNKVRHKNNYNSKFYKKNYDSLKLNLIDSSATAIFLHAFKEPYVFRALKNLEKIKLNQDIVNLNDKIDSIESNKLNNSTEINFNAIKIGQTIQLKNVLFELSKDVLLESSYPTLSSLLNFLKENPKVVILLSGHTDYTGNSRANKKLSKQRVQKVKEYLITNGINSSHVKLKWYGGKFPLVKSPYQDERSVNRRVEVILLEK